MGVDRWWDVENRRRLAPPAPPPAAPPRSRGLARINAKHPVLFDPARVSTVRIESSEAGGDVVVVHTRDGYAFAVAPAADQTAIGLFEQVADLVET